MSFFKCAAMTSFFASRSSLYAAPADYIRVIAFLFKTKRNSGSEFLKAALEYYIFMPSIFRRLFTNISRCGYFLVQITFIQ